jgi:hypothetical protein
MSFHNTRLVAESKIKRADPSKAFRLRCWARGYLARNYMLDLHAAVDVLQADAERQGLIAQYGQDLIQQWIAEGFQDERRGEQVRSIGFPCMEGNRA